MSETENKRVFLIATASAETNRQLETLVKNHVQGATVFTAVDGTEAAFKCINVPPNVVIIDYNIPKTTALEVTAKLIRRKERVAIIILSPLPDQDHFIDEVITGQVQFLSGTEKVKIFGNHLTRALNWFADVEKSLYKMKFLGAEEPLIQEGEKADFVYLVKSGELKAYKKNGDKEVMLGKIHAGEFVGEMAYINGEARSANVDAITACELIEIPSECLDAVLFSKPAWSKSLLKTLSKRLKTLNELKVSKPS